MKTILKNGKDEITLEMAIKLQKNDRIVLDKWGVKKVKEVKGNTVTLEKVK